MDIDVLAQFGSLQAGSQLTNASTGIIYITIGEVLLNAAVVSASVRAANDNTGTLGAGDIGNIADGGTLTFVNSLENVSKIVTVTSTTVTGADGESIDDYRQRVLDKWQKPPQGGAYSDYELWGEEAAGIVNIYPYTSAVAGFVDVYAEASDTFDGIPTQDQLDDVAALIEQDQNGLASRRPVGARVNVLPIIRTAFVVTVQGLDASNLAQAQIDITSAVEEYFLGRAPFIDGLSIPPALDRITRTSVSGVVEDIATAIEATFTGVTFQLEGAGFGLEAYVLGGGEKAKASSVVFP